MSGGPLATRFLAISRCGVKTRRRRGETATLPGRNALGGWVGDVRATSWNANAVSSAAAQQAQCGDRPQTAAGRDTFLELVAVADVVIENFSARAMPSLRLGYDDLKKANPRIVYVTAPGYGATGPWCDRVAFGPTVEPMSGLTTVMGYGADEPRNTAMALMDPITGVNATAAVLTALRRRQRPARAPRRDVAPRRRPITHCGPWLIRSGSSAAFLRGWATATRHGAARRLPCADEDGWSPSPVAPTTSGGPWSVSCARRRHVAGRTWTSRTTAAGRLDEAIAAWSAGRRMSGRAAIAGGGGAGGSGQHGRRTMTPIPRARPGLFRCPLEPGPTPMAGNPIKMAPRQRRLRPCPGLGADKCGWAQWLDYGPERIASWRGGT